MERTRRGIARLQLRVPGPELAVEAVDDPEGDGRQHDRGNEHDERHDHGVQRERQRLVQERVAQQLDDERDDDRHRDREEPQPPERHGADSTSAASSRSISGIWAGLIR